MLRLVVQVEIQASTWKTHPKRRPVLLDELAGQNGNGCIRAPGQLTCALSTAMPGALGRALPAPGLGWSASHERGAQSRLPAAWSLGGNELMLGGVGAGTTHGHALQAFRCCRWC